MVPYVSQLVCDFTQQKFGCGINAIFPIVAVLWAKTAKNSGGTAGVFAVFCSPDPTEPRISAEPDASLADNSWEEQRKQRNRGVQSSQSAPKTPFRGAVSRAAQNAA